MSDYHIEWGMTRARTKPAGAFSHVVVATRKQAVKLATGLVWGVFEDDRKVKEDKLNALKRDIVSRRDFKTTHVFSDDETRWVSVTKLGADNPGAFSGTRAAKDGPHS